MQYVQSAPASPFNWLAAALFAASAATGAAFLMMKKRVVSGYEAIRDEPTGMSLLDQSTTPGDEQWTTKLLTAVCLYM